MGMFLSGACVSSAMLVRSSKPVNAKNASRAAKPMPLHCAKLAVGMATSDEPIGRLACPAAGTISTSPPTSMSVKMRQCEAPPELGCGEFDGHGDPAFDKRQRL